MYGTLTLCTVLFCMAQGHLQPGLNLNLSYEWLDPLTVRVSWTPPKHLPHHCALKYEVKLNGFESRDVRTHYRTELLTESAAAWTCRVQALGTSACRKHNIATATLQIQPPRPPAVVTDFRCYLLDSAMHCSWISDPSSPVSLSYRVCGTFPGLLRNCSQTFSHGQRTVCHMTGSFLQKKLCMVATTRQGVSTFRLKKAVRLPNLLISEQGANLVLTWDHLELETPCLLYNVCYSACDNSSICREHSPKEEFLKILFDRSCQYKFRYRVQSHTIPCEPIHSVWSEDILYSSSVGTWTVVVTIVTPLFFSACVILSCICFRRHRKIICPELPDPSVIFKEMINSNKDNKPDTSTYRVIPERVEPLVIVPHIPHTSGLVLA